MAPSASSGRDAALSTLARNVKSARQQRGWSQDELARRAANLSARQISRVESGTRDIRMTTLLELLEALELEPNQLLKGTY